MFNKIVLVGNLTRAIELRYSAAGLAIANTAIATSRKFTSNGEKKEEVCFVDITSFGRSGEVLNQYCRKGSKVLIEGRLNFEQWQDQNGQKRSKHTVIVETLQMLDSKGDSQPQAHNPNANPTQNMANTEPPKYKHTDYQPRPEQQHPPSNQPPLIDIDQDDIPF